MGIKLPDASYIIGTITTLIGSILAYLWIKREKEVKKQVLLENSSVKYKVSLIAKENLSWNVRLFRFGLPSENHVLGVKPGQHIYTSAKINDDLVIRPYSPVTSDSTKGYFDLVIKVYFKNQHPKYPNGGKMSQYLDSLNIGDMIDIRGPDGNLFYASKGNFLIRKSKNASSEKFHYNKVGMIAGGTGLTPLLRILREIIANPEDETRVWLLFSNHKSDDILLRDELDEIAKEHPDQVKIWYTIGQLEEGWQYSVGRINEDLIRDHMPSPADDTVILMCGPPPMIKEACHPNLDKLGYDQTKRFVF